MTFELTQPATSPYLDNAPLVKNRNSTTKGAIFQRVMEKIRENVLFYAKQYMDSFVTHVLPTDLDFISAVAEVICHRDFVSKWSRPAMVIVEVCMIEFEHGAMASRAATLTAMQQGLRAFYEHLPFDIKRTLEVNGIPPAWVSDNAVDIPVTTINQILTLLAKHETRKSVPIQILTKGLLAFSKKGVVTTEYAMMVSKAIQGETGFNFDIDVSILSYVWNIASVWMTAAKAQEFFKYWEANGRKIVTLRELCQQAKWQGMKHYIIIRTAITKFTDFPWEHLHKLFGEELTCFKQAKAIVGDDEFYGYNQDLGPTQTIHFPNLTYTAWKLLTVEQDSSLCGYKCAYNEAEHAKAIDAIIEQYVAAKRVRAAAEMFPIGAALAYRISGIVKLPGFSSLKKPSA